MSEEELLYEALKRPLGLVVRADKARLQKALARLKKSDPALLELLIFGPDGAGNIYILRSLEAKKQRADTTATG